MRKFVLIGLLLMSTLGFTQTANGAISQGTAQNTAQAYQRSECGFAWNWVCADSGSYGQYCYAYGNSRWYCAGTAIESYYLQLVGGTRFCDIQVQVGGYSNTIVYHYNACRH